MQLRQTQKPADNIPFEYKQGGCTKFSASASAKGFLPAAAKMAIMRECGIHVVDSPAEIGDTMLRVLSGK